MARINYGKNSNECNFRNIFVNDIIKCPLAKDKVHHQHQSYVPRIEDGPSTQWRVRKYYPVLPSCFVAWWRSFNNIFNSLLNYVCCIKEFYTGFKNILRQQSWKRKPQSHQQPPMLFLCFWPWKILFWSKTNFTIYTNLSSYSTPF